MTKDSALQALARASGLPETKLKDFKTLDAAQIEALAQKMDAAQKRQEKQLAAALEGTLAHLPLLLRGPVRAIFGR